MNQPGIAVLWDRPSVSLVCQLLLLCCLPLAAVLQAAPQAGKQTPLKIAFQFSSPYQFPDAAGLPTGPTAELMRAASAGEGIHLQWVLAPNEALAVPAFHRGAVYQVVLIGVWALTGTIAAMVWLVRRLRAARRQANMSPGVRAPRNDVLGMAGHSLDAETAGRLIPLMNAGPPPDPAPSTSLDRLRTLIVDDNEANRRAIHLQVSRWGMRDTSSATSQQALEEIRAAQRTGDPYHFLIADFQMPDMDGASLAAAVKNDPAIHNTIVVMLASTGSWRELQRLDCAHVDACLPKPVRQSQLLEALSSTWSRRSLAVLAARVEPHAGLAPDRSPARVLVADGNAANRKAAVRMLESVGLKADVSANGREAVDMLRLLPYDLVLMDCQMPFMDGQEAAMEIRKREPPNRRTPIVAMTTETGADCLDDCLASGMDDILLKPVRREKLIATLHRWLPAA